jgi:hypothetical protein
VTVDVSKFTFKFGGTGELESDQINIRMHMTTVQLRIECAMVIRNRQLCVVILGQHAIAVAVWNGGG